MDSRGQSRSFSSVLLLASSLAGASCTVIVGDPRFDPDEGAPIVDGGFDAAARDSASRDALVGADLVMAPIDANLDGTTPPDFPQTTFDGQPGSDGMLPPGDLAMRDFTLLTDGAPPLPDLTAPDLSSLSDLAAPDLAAPQDLVTFPDFTVSDLVTGPNDLTSTSCSTANPCASGCCSSSTGGMCLTGTSQNACGKPGFTCTDCAVSASGHLCINNACGCNAAGDCPAGLACNTSTHLCTASCTSTQLCNGGCCTAPSGGTCVAGSSPSACGSSGAVCTNCAGNASGMACLTSGKCGCLSQGDCAATETCDLGTNTCYTPDMAMGTGLTCKISGSPIHIASDFVVNNVVDVAWQGDQWGFAWSASADTDFGVGATQLRYGTLKMGTVTYWPVAGNDCAGCYADFPRVAAASTSDLSFIVGDSAFVSTSGSYGMGNLFSYVRGNSNAVPSSMGVAGCMNISEGAIAIDVARSGSNIGLIATRVPGGGAGSCSGGFSMWFGTLNSGVPTLMPAPQISASVPSEARLFTEKQSLQTVFAGLVGGSMINSGIVDLTNGQATSVSTPVDFSTTVSGIGGDVIHLGTGTSNTVFIAAEDSSSSLILAAFPVGANGTVSPLPTTITGLDPASAMNPIGAGVGMTTTTAMPMLLVGYSAGGVPQVVAVDPNGNPVSTPLVLSSAMRKTTLHPQIGFNGANFGVSYTEDDGFYFANVTCN